MIRAVLADARVRRQEDHARLDQIAGPRLWDLEGMRLHCRIGLKMHDRRARVGSTTTGHSDLWTSRDLQSQGSSGAELGHPTRYE